MVRNGVFPHNDFRSNVAVFDAATPLGKGVAPPVQVVSAAAVTATTVTVLFSVEMKHTNPSDPKDVLNPANYAFSCVGGVVVYAQSVVCTEENPTRVTVTTTEMTQSASYTVEVSNVESIDNRPINPAADTANFVGIGVSPNLLSVVAESATTLKLTFDELMENSVYLNSTDSYQISPLHVTFGSVVVTDNPIIRLLISSGEMLTGGNYTMTVSSGLRDAAQNAINVRTRNFVGVGIAPRLTGASFVAPNKVRVYFNEAMDESTIGNKSNYTVSRVGGGILVITEVTEVTSTSALITVTSFPTSGTYRVEGNSSIKDLRGNILDPDYDTYDFAVSIATKPVIEVSPPDGTVGYDPRLSVSLRFYDIAEGFKGVKKSTINVSFEINAVPVVAVSGGEINLVAFTGSVSGDPLSPNGITYQLLPRGYWTGGMLFIGRASVEDLDGAQSTSAFSFTTTRSGCAEDYPIVPYDIEKLLLEATFSNAVMQMLYELLLHNVTRSNTTYANTRTLLFFAGIGAAYALVSDVVPKIESSLCDRISVLDCYRLVRSVLPQLVEFVRRTATIPELDREVFLRYLQHESPVEVVCAAVALLIYVVNNHV